MADVFDHRLKTSYGAIKREHANQVDVPEDRKYIGSTLTRRPWTA